MCLEKILLGQKIDTLFLLFTGYQCHVNNKTVQLLTGLRGMGGRRSIVNLNLTVINALGFSGIKSAFKSRKKPVVFR